MASPPRPGVGRTDWWQRDIPELKILEFIYSCVLTLDIGSRLLDPAQTETLLNEPKLDTAIVQAYRHHLSLPKSQGDIPDCRTPEWKNDKRQILQCLAKIHQQTYEAVDSKELRHFTKQQASNNQNDPWTPLEVSGYSNQRIPQAYHTPKTPATGPARAPSETNSTTSDRTATVDDPYPHRSESAESLVSRGSRRKRSSSSMQNEKPGKRARGPQEHICQVCRKKFPFLSKLTDHMKTHSNEKLLRCQHCRKSFKRTREVNAHLKSVHKIDTLQVPNRPPPSPTTPFYPPTPASVPTPASLPTPAPFPMFPLTPASSTPLPPPRPSPRPPPYPGQTYTPVPTPEQFSAPTPADTETEYQETPSAFTPRITATEDDRGNIRELSYRGAPDDEDVKPILKNIIEATKKVDLNEDCKLAPLLNVQPEDEPRPNITTEKEPLPCEKPEVDTIRKGTSTPTVPTDDISGPKNDNGAESDGSEITADPSPSTGDRRELLTNILFPQ